MKKPFLYAGSAFAYIASVILAINSFSNSEEENQILIPIFMLSLLVFSVAVMAFLFFYRPLELFLENKKKEAVMFFLKTLGIFACFALAFSTLIFLI